MCISSLAGEVSASAAGQQNRGSRHLHQQRCPFGKLVQSSMEKENVVNAQKQQE